MTKQIALSKSGKKNSGLYFAIVDDADFERVNALNWNVLICSEGRSIYATRTDYRTRKPVMMHRFILGTSGETKIDHRDGDGLNNTRQNLRVATKSQNAANQKRRKDNSSGVKGVKKYHNKYAAAIQFNKKQIYLGLFPTPEAAARAYDAKAIELFGEFARLNFPREATV